MIVTSAAWDEFIASHPEAHLLQTREWGDLKSDFGWEALRVVNGTSGAQVLIRRLLIGVSIAYLPKGPIGLLTDELFNELITLCRQHKAVFLKIEPDAFEGETLDGINGALKWPRIERTATIQPQRTLMLRVDDSENGWLGRMKQKTRYNINLAEKKGITVQPSSDIDAFYQMMITTGDRDGFGIHTQDYYQKAYDLFHGNGKCELLMAHFLDKPLAGLMTFAHGDRSWYLYGASTNLERNRMPTYLLQMESMRWAANKGCTTYDLWGVPDLDEETLEREFVERSDGLWGVYRFKRGFGGELLRSVDAYDLVFNPMLYKFYRVIRNRSAL